MALVVKNPLANAGGMRLGFYPCVGKIPWSGAWQPTQCSCWRIPMDRGAWWAMVEYD